MYKRIISLDYTHTGPSGFYLRQVSEPSITDPSVNVLLCQFFTDYANGTFETVEATFMGEADCLATLNDPLYIISFRGLVTDLQVVELSLPVADYTRSDILGAFDLPPTDDTADR